MLIKEYTTEGYVKRLRSKDKFKAIEELAQVFTDTGVCDSVDDLVSALIEREKIMSTGIGFGLAIPHAKIKAVRQIAFAIGISKSGIDFDSIDGRPVCLIILVAAGEKQHKDYLKLLSKVMAILKSEEMRERIINFTSPADVMEIFARDME